MFHVFFFFISCGICVSDEAFFTDFASFHGINNVVVVMEEGTGGKQSVKMKEFEISFILQAKFSGHIWLICTRMVTPLEICRWFPQIVFTLLTCVRPMNVGFSNRFFCLSDKRFPIFNIKIFF